MTGRMERAEVGDMVRCCCNTKTICTYHETLFIVADVRIDGTGTFKSYVLYGSPGLIQDAGSLMEIVSKYREGVDD